MEKIVLTGRVANIESTINDLKIDLLAINDKLKNAYDYKDELFNRHKQADENIKALHESFFAKHSEIMAQIDKIKDAVDIYTAQLY